MIPGVPARLHIARLFAHLYDYSGFDARCIRQRSVGNILQLDMLTGPQRDVGRYQQFAVRIVNAVLQRIRAETAEYN